MLGTKSEILFDLGRYDEAMESINKCLALEPNFEEALDLKGKIQEKL